MQESSKLFDRLQTQRQDMMSQKKREAQEKCDKELRQRQAEIREARCGARRDVIDSIVEMVYPKIVEHIESMNRNLAQETSVCLSRRCGGSAYAEKNFGEKEFCCSRLTTYASYVVLNASLKRRLEEEGLAVTVQHRDDGRNVTLDLDDLERSYLRDVDGAVVSTYRYASFILRISWKQ